MAERTLRERCIEAGAKAIANDRAEGPVTFAHLDDAEAAFDAVLGVLTEHADEYGHGASCFDLIAAMEGVSDD